MVVESDGTEHPGDVEFSSDLDPNDGDGEAFLNLEITLGNRVCTHTHTVYVCMYVCVCVCIHTHTHLMGNGSRSNITKVELCNCLWNGPLT